MRKGQLFINLKTNKNENIEKTDSKQRGNCKFE